MVRSSGETDITEKPLQYDTHELEIIPPAKLDKRFLLFAHDDYERLSALEGVSP